MNGITDIYRAEVLRATFGPRYSEFRVHDAAHLNRIVGILADAEAARTAMHAKGYGRGASSFVEVVRQVPDHAPALLKRMFAPRTPVCYPTAQRKP